MTDVEKLLAIDEIKRVKSKYFYGLDHKDWEFWRREVWAADATLSQSTADQVSVHHGHMPNIEITSADTATGVWAMEDRVYRTKAHALADGSTFLHGFGHYRETYVRAPQGWRIASTRLTRLRIEMSKII